MSKRLNFVQIYKGISHYKTVLLTLCLFFLLAPVIQAQKTILYTSDSSAYAIGDVVEGLKQGKWQYYNKNDVKIEEGVYNDNKRQGEWIAYSNGRKVMEVYYKDNEPIYYKEYYANGRMYLEGKLENSLKEGKWTKYHQELQAPWEVINYEKNLKQGPFTSFYLGGNVEIEATYKDDSLHGEYVRYNDYGEVVEKGRYENGQRVGLWTESDEYGKKMSEKIFNAEGKADSVWTEYHVNGRIASRKIYDDGKPEGVWTSYYPNGQIAEWSHYDEGWQDSVYYQFFENGQIAVQGNYQNGLRTGIWQFFNDGGVLVEEGRYELGEQDGRWFTYYDNGKLRMIGAFDNGMEDGLWGVFHPNEQLMQEEEWRDGKLWNISTYITAEGDSLPPGTLKDGEGTKLNYYSTGTREIYCEFQNGVPHGTWNYYYEDGTIAETGQFVLGVKDGPWVYYYENGRKESEGKFEKGEKTGEWTYYNRRGDVSERIDHSN